MKSTILSIKKSSFAEVPISEWIEGLEQAHLYIGKRLAFMTENHHRVRKSAVRELPIQGKPLPVDFFVDKLEIDAEEVFRILTDLEKNLLFLVRNEKGEVHWAFPVTVDQTPHSLTFSTGERLNAA